MNVDAKKHCMQRAVDRKGPDGTKSYMKKALRDGRALPKFASPYPVP